MNSWKVISLCVFLISSVSCFAQDEGGAAAEATAAPHEYKSTKFKGMSKFGRINSAEDEIISLRQEVNQLRDEVNALKKEVAALKDKKDVPVKKEGEI